MSKPSSSSLTPSAETSPPQLDLNAVLDCSFGNYPWDDWHGYALARGLSPELAGQGRLLVREAYQHDWPDQLKSLCGWSDDGQALLAFALRAPKSARRQWDILMRTDGLRGDVHPKTGEWTWGYLRLDTRRVLSALHNATLDAGDGGKSSIVNRKS
jgi:hypothetical protein